jgi:glycolate oxidase iron-sulfur subunit
VLLRRLLDGDIEPEEIGPDAFDFCTLCYACQTACPAGVRTEHLFTAARKVVADANGIAPAKRFVFKSFESPRRVETAVKLGSAAQKLLGRRTVDALAGGMAVPPLRSKPAIAGLDEVLPAKGRRRARVGLFLGCMSNYVDDRPALAAIEVLRRLGAEVVIPRDQHCCGAPAFNNGDYDTARTLARVNLELFQQAEVDALVSPDATCGGAFRLEYLDLLREDDPARELAEEMAARSLDWASFIVEHLDPRFPETRRPPVSVTVHDSCHLTHTAGKQDNVRRLLELLPGVEIAEMEESTICCGFGGSFSSLYPEQADRWLDRKLEHAVATRAEVMVAASPGCISTLRTRLERTRRGAIRALHPAELIADRCDWLR